MLTADYFVRPSVIPFVITVSMIYRYAEFLLFCIIYLICQVNNVLLSILITEKARAPLRQSRRLAEWEAPTWGT